MRREFAEGALRFVIPETVQLSDALVEKLLSIAPCRGDRKVDGARALDRFCGLPGPLVERLPLVRVPGKERLFSLPTRG